MSPISNITDLKLAILSLENKQSNERRLLKEQCLSTYESLKPFNFIRNKLKEASTSTDFKDNLLVNTVGLAAGFASKALVVGESKSTIKKLLGTIVQMGVSHLITKNPQVVKLISNKIGDFLNSTKATEIPEKEDHAA